MKYFVSISIIVAVMMGALMIDDGLLGLLVILPLVLAIVFLIRRYGVDSDYLIKVFIGGLVARLFVSGLIVGFGLQETFGEDSLTHESNGYQLWQLWVNGGSIPYYLSEWHRAWGLNWLIASVYSVFGRAPNLINFIGATVGAATALVVYSISWHIYQNRGTARISALLTAFFPAMLIWSSQIMKDGYVVFLIALTILLLIRLQERFRLLDFVLTFASLGAILSFRFYIFYFAAFACVASVVFGKTGAVENKIRNAVLFAGVVIVIAYSGVLTVGREQVEKFSNLETIQSSRATLSKDAASGYGTDSDITTASGMALALPLGLVNLLFAPFPWQLTSVRSALTLPEMLVWWALLPALLVGISYTFKNRFTNAIPMLAFTFTLTVAYALFQTNVGTAYRQRTQIQVFLFIFIAAGWTIFKERRADKQALRHLNQRWVGQMTAN